MILDEVLAVGDEAFQRKCNDYFMERKKSGKTTILVTHDMGAVKKYCNQAVLIENGLVKALGNPDDVANQYSFDNAVAPTSVTEDKKEAQEESLCVDNLKVELLSANTISPREKVQFRISYDVLDDTATYIAFSLTDIDRNIWIYNDNSLDYMTNGKGHKSVIYTCDMPSLNDIKLKLQVSVRDDDDKMVAFADTANSPVVFIVRDDIATDDISEKDSATGLLQRRGKWEFKK